MKNCYLKRVILILIVIFPILIMAQSFQWTYHAGSPVGSNHVIQCVCDGNGNSYMLITFEILENSQPLLNNNPINVLYDTNVIYTTRFLLLISYDCYGSLRWYRSIRSGHSDPENYPSFGIGFISSMELINNRLFIAIQGEGNKLLLRDETGNDTTLNISDNYIYAPADAFISLDTNGNLLWKNSLTTNIFPVTSQNNIYRCYPQQITFDNESNLHVLYHITSFGADNHPSFPLDSNTDLYILKYDTSGTFLSSHPLEFWSNGYGVQNPHLKYYQGKYYFTGDSGSNDTIIVNGIRYPKPVLNSRPALYIARLDTGGYCLNYKYLSPDCNAYDMDITDLGDIYLAGSVSEQFDGIFLNNPYNYNSEQVFLSKLDTSFNTLYLKNAWSDDPDYNEALSMIILSNNRIAIGGQAQGGTLFDSIQCPISSMHEPFIAVYDENEMKFIHAKQISSHGMDEVEILANDQNDNLIIAGKFSSPFFSIGDSLFYNYGNDDIFFGRYGWQCGELANWTSAVPELETVSEEIRIYPNPTSSFLYLESESLPMKEYTLYDFTGRIQQSAIIHDTHCTLNLSRLASGLYLIRVYLQNGHIETLKFSKQ
jgi:hypothetical protein